jgi:glc operon protein GlcG
MLDARRDGVMTLTRQATRLTHEGAQALLAAAIAHATMMGVPQCVAVVDEGCNLLAFIRMDGARVLSITSSQRKAMTAATTGKPTGDLAEDLGQKLALATEGRMVNLKGGVPVIVDGQVIGGIGVGSGTGEQDREIANAGLKGLAGATVFSFPSS